MALTRRPYFALLLGDLDGWRPPPATLRSDHLEALRTQMGPEGAALVYLWCVEDRNAVPPVHVLQPRRGWYVADEAC